MTPAPVPTLRIPVRVPLLATILVTVAAAIMAMLGVWQLDRRAEKAQLLAQYTANLALPAVSFPLVPTDDALLFRRASLFCIQASGETVAAGQSRDGRNGWRHLVLCRRGAEGPGAMVDIGWSPGFDTRLGWRGGKVDGRIAPRPEHRSVLAAALTRAPRQMLLIADVPAPGLVASAAPSLADIPNNHLAYAIQWFAFAGIALLIYALALRRRWRTATPRP